MSTEEEIENLKTKMDVWLEGFRYAAKTTGGAEKHEPPKIFTEARRILGQAAYEIKLLRDTVARCSTEPPTR